jgi:glycosyltransferase involved in cell wall biosynthesis
MPRVGHNPMKEFRQSFVPSEVTVCTLVYIPELTGYWAHSLDVLKVCLSSIRANTPPEADLVVLDNGSCSEVRRHLKHLSDEGVIDVLILCAENHGKPGAWNTLFPACQGKYIAYTDSDVAFCAGWLKKTMDVFATYDNIGMVTGCPVRNEPRSREALLSATLHFADTAPDLTVERGNLIPQDYLDVFGRSLGRHSSEMFNNPSYEDVRMTRRGVSVYAAAGHFQFVARRDLAMQLLPIAPKHALGGESDQWDRKINQLGLLRICLDEPHVWHLGNTLDAIDVELLKSIGYENEIAGSLRQTDPERVGLLKRALRLCARRGPTRRIMQKAYLSLFEALR